MVCIKLCRCIIFAFQIEANFYDAFVEIRDNYAEYYGSALRYVNLNTYSNYKIEMVISFVVGNSLFY